MFSNGAIKGDFKQLLVRLEKVGEFGIIIVKMGG